MSENPPSPSSPRARLQQLLAIPERQRTDEQWDEINELEIMLAAGNRQGAPDPRVQQQQQQQRNAPGGGARPRRGGESPHDRNNQQRKFHHKRPRRHPPGR
jgi:hypothetical protein